MTQARCSGTNRDGGPCSAPALPGRSLCAWHHPAMRERVAAGRAKGGKGRSNSSRARRSLPPAMTGAELLAVLTRAIEKVERGELAPGPANAIASLARAMNATREMVEIESRLVALEQAAGLERTA